MVINVNLQLEEYYNYSPFHKGRQPRSDFLPRVSFSYQGSGSHEQYGRDEMSDV